MASNQPILYSYFRSSCSWRVRIALAWKQIDYEYRAINLAKGEQFSEEFTKINPLQEVPVFLENEEILTQSVPILEYLEETRSEFPLLPSSPVNRAKVRSVVETITSGIQPLQNLNVLKAVGDKNKEWGRKWIERGFKGLENYLQPLHGKCCIGNVVTLADVVLIPQIYNAEKRFDVDMSQFPILSAIQNHLMTYDAFKLTHPSVQPDTPKE